MSKTKKFSKVIAVLLAFAMVFTVLPYDFGYALAVSETAEESAGDITSEAIAISEIIGERDEYTKRFKMSDGTIAAAQYDRPVHYQDESGNWVDYDNTFVAANDTEDGGNADDAVNVSSDFNVRFSKNSNGNKIITVKADDYKLSWNYEGINKTTVQTSAASDDGDMTTLDKLTSEALYADAFTDTDIQYLLTSNELKENIILNSQNSPSEFIVNYKGAQLSAEQIDDKTIHVNNENGDTVYVINAPYMTDANGVYSDGISLDIVSSSNNKFTVKTVLDKEWLSDSDRTYPVTVDPIFVTSQKWENIRNNNYCQSAYISSKNPSVCYGYSPNSTTWEGSLYVGRENGREKTRSFIKYIALPELDECEKIVDAKIALYLNDSTANLTVDLYRVTGTWTQSTINWNNAPTYDNTKIEYKRIKYGAGDEWETWEITGVVRGWYSGEYENNGIMFMSESETATSSKRAWFFSTGYTSLSVVRPCIVISYRNMSGYEDYYSYTSIDAGRSGVASVNNYNGNLTYTQYLTESAGGNLMPVSLSLVYNSNKTAQTYSTLGEGMQTNYHLYIAENPNVTDDSTDDEKKYKYYLNDADGTAHYFYFENLTDTTAKDEDGLGYTITINSSVSATSLTEYKYTVEDKSKNKMYFNGYGYLVKVEDSNGNASTVAYTLPSGSTVPRINTITDGAGNIYNFIYGDTDQNLITAVKDPANRQTTLTYTDGKISAITYADSKTVSLAYNIENIYNSNKNLRITGINSYVDVVYYGTDESRISSMIRKNGDTVLESYGFSYKQNETVITDYMERSYTYQFNDFGQTTGIVSNINGQAQFFSYTSGNSTSGDANKLLSESKIQTSVKNYIVNPTATGGITDYSVRVDEGDGNAVSYDSSIGHFSNGAVKISKATTGSELVNAYQTFTLPAGTYTLSAYVKSNGEIAGNGAVLTLSAASNSSTTKIASSTNWQRYSAIIETTSTQTITAQIGFPSGSTGTIWADDIQLEQNTGEGSFNLVENPGFGNSTSKWTVTATNKSVVTLDDGDLYGYDKALKISSDVTEQTNCVQTVNVSGSKGDVFAVGAWAKAHSAPLDNGTKEGDTCIPEFKLQIEFFNSSNSVVSSKHQNFNPDVNTWQFNSFCAIADGEYAYAKVSVIYNNNINELSTTGIYCNKEEYGQTYTYDKDGNVVSSKDLASTSSSFAYKGNQMSMLLNPSGSSYLYSYDSGTNNLLYANSTDGQQYSFTYDDKGNVTQTVIEQSRPATTITSGKTYVLRNAYSGNAMRWNGTNAVNNRYISGNTDQQWIVTVSDSENSIYTLKSVSASQYLNIANSTTGTKFTLNPTATVDAQKFELQFNKDNGTYSIITNCEKCVDGQPGDSTETDDGTVISQQPYVKNDLGQQWYLYPLVDSSAKKMTSSATYTENKNYVSTVTDAAGNTVSYNYDSKKGTLTSTTDAKNNTLQYSYDINNRVTSIYSGLDEYIDYEYLNDRLDKITAFDNVVYDFTYDAFGNTTRTRVGNGTDFRNLATNTYDNYGRLSQMTYGNGTYVNYFYDSLDRLVKKQYNGDDYKTVEYKYNNNGSLSLFIDGLAFNTTRYIYDLSGRLVAANTYNGINPNNLGTANNSVSYRYADKTNYLTGITHTSTDLGTSKLDYTYGDISEGQMPDQIYNVKWNDVTKKAYVYDGLGRITSETVYPVNSSTNALESTYTYKNLTGNNTTTLVSGLDNAAGTTFFTYDANGNIIQTMHCDSNLPTLYYEATYSYDKFNQLTGYSDDQTGKSYTFAYDDNGNITTYRVNGINKTFGYTDSVWGDLLTSYNGNTITYDEIGNPLTYKNGETFTWENGRQLNFIFKDNDILAVYSYDSDGKRVSKYTDDGDTFFTYAGDILAGQKTGDNVLVWIYDNNGKYIGFTYNGTEYYYVYNLQGDVVALANSTGTIIARYTYGPWGTVDAVTDDLGNDISGNATHIANINPIRYRGYYYDTETGFYYLNSRYYDPEICRFINADTTDILTATPMALTDKNLFSYCDNNPVVRADDGGQFWNTIIGAVTGAIVGGVSAAIMGTDIKAGIVSGGISGGIAGAALDITIATGGTGLVALAIVSGVSGVGSAIGSYTNQRMNGISHNDVDWGTVAIDGMWGAVAGALSFGVADIGGSTCKTLKQTLSQPIRKIGKQAVNDFAMTTTISSGTLLNGTKINSLRTTKKSTIDRRSRAAKRYSYRYRRAR